MFGLREAGFFREMTYGYSATIDDRRKPSLLESIHRLDRTDKEKITAYLTSGNVLFMAYGVSKDVLCFGKIIGTMAILTDGIWVWPKDLAYYVEEYDVALPDDFITHMRETGWQAAMMTSEEMARFSL